MEELANLIKKREGEEDQDWEEEEDLTLEEREELEALHEEEMALTQEEEDWMLIAIIKKERNILAKKYLPVLENYKVEDICDICERYFYRKGNLETHIKKVHIEEKSPHKLQVIPQEGWLSRSLPNLEDLLTNIPSNILISKEDELESKKDFEDIMCEFKNVQVEMPEAKNQTLNCSKCKFNTSSKDSLEIHIENVHEQCVYKCEQCTQIFISVTHLKIHKKLRHTKKPVLVIKNSLNLIKGETGGLSNPNRGQAILYKRDKVSIKTGYNYQLNKKESTNVDTKSESNYQNCPILIKQSLNLIKGEAGDLSNPNRGQAKSKCFGSKKESKEPIVIKKTP